MDDVSLYEKMCYMTKDIDTWKGMEDDIDPFRNLKMVKQDADKVNINLIHPMNCGSINSGPSYVFKTSQKELKTAWKIDARCAKSATWAKTVILVREWKITLTSLEI